MRHLRQQCLISFLLLLASDFTDTFDQIPAGRSKKPWITAYDSEGTIPHRNEGIHI